MNTNLIGRIGGAPIYFTPHSSNVLVDVRVHVAVGSFHERPGQEGLAHLTEHMFFKGNRGMNAEQLTRRMAAIGQMNGYTANHETVYYIDCPPRKTASAFEILAESLFYSAVFDEEHPGFEQERDVVLQEWNMGQDSAFQVAFAELYRTERNHWTPIGTKDSIESFKLSDVRDFIKEHYNASNVSFHITGSIPLKQLRKELEQFVTDYDLPSWWVSEPGDSDIVRLSRTPVDTKDTWHLNQSIMMINFDPINWWDLSDRDKAAVNVAINMLGSGLHGILPNELREKQGLCYTSGLHGEKNYWQLWPIVYAITDASKIEQVVEKSKELLGDILSGNYVIDPELLETACGSYEAEYLAGLQDPDYVVRRSVGYNVFANSVNPDAYVLAIQTMTMDEVIVAVRRLLSGTLSVLVRSK